MIKQIKFIKHATIIDPLQTSQAILQLLPLLISEKEWEVQTPGLSSFLSRASLWPQTGVFLCFRIQWLSSLSQLHCGTKKSFQYV